MNTRPLRTLSYVVFFLGVVIGLALSVITIWNRLEATNYYFRGAKHDPFNGLRCPVMVAPTEKGIVTVVFNNPTNEEDNFFYRAEISGKAFSTRQVEDKIALPPHQSKSIRLTVDANDIDLLFFILVKITILPNSVHSAQEAVCGIMVVNILGLTGTPIFIAALSLSLLGIVIGFGIWQKTSTHADQNMQRIMQALGLLVLLTMFAGLMGWWLPGMALAVIAMLIMIIFVGLAIA